MFLTLLCVTTLAMMTACGSGSSTGAGAAADNDTAASVGDGDQAKPVDKDAGDGATTPGTDGGGATTPGSDGGGATTPGSDGGGATTPGTDAGGGGKASDICPKGCKKWFDGCNTCDCVDGKPTGCTEMACSKKQPTKCLDKPAGPECGDGNCDKGETAKTCPKDCKSGGGTPDGTCPKGCKSWFDGCNNCSCVDGKVGACTKKGCPVKQPTKCLDTPASKCGDGKCDKAGGETAKTCPKDCKGGIGVPGSCPPDCKKWYDGCNTCDCVKGKISVCTNNVCKKMGTPKCLDGGGGISGCTVGAKQCHANEFCKLSKPGTCSGTGTCTVMAQICLTVYAPVCGCDSKTYSNKCKANGKGVNLHAKGVCSGGGSTVPCAPPCKTWFDGCNKCSCINGQIGGCTKKFCPVKKTPTCLN